MRVEAYNAQEGKLAWYDGYDCPLCKNKGQIARIGDAGEMWIRPCKCMRARKAIRLLEKSGLSETIKHFSWASWQTVEPWQREALRAAQDFARRPAGWFVAFGSPGTGKTHICTAICGDLLRAGVEVIYQPWQELAKGAKAKLMDAEAYELATSRFKTSEVVYFDDFLKCPRGKTPTPADLDFAFEMVNARYCKPGLITILSTEWTPVQILSMDEALGRRIVERARGRMLDLTGKQNWSLKG